MSAPGSTAAGAPRRQVNDREPPNRFILRVERYLPRRVGRVATLAILFGSAAFGIVKGGQSDEFTTALSDTRNAAGQFCRLPHHHVAQRPQAAEPGRGACDRRRPTVAPRCVLDAQPSRPAEGHPWIADATILKLIRPAADRHRRAHRLRAWQENGRLAVIAADGAVLEPYCFAPLPQSAAGGGKGADVRAKDFLAAARTATRRCVR